MKKIKGSRKTTLTALLLCVTALTGCKDVITEEVNNNLDTNIIREIPEEIDKGVNKISYTITDNYISISRQNYGQYEEVEDSMYSDINEALKDKSRDSIFIDRLNSQVDFNLLDLSGIKRIWLDEPGEDFDYRPFYNATYYTVNIDVSSNTNTKRITDFLAHLKLDNALVSINFRNTSDIELQNAYLEALANVKGLTKLHITSDLAEKLDLNIVKPDELTLYIETTDPTISYTFKINENVKNFCIAPNYPEEYDETSSLDNITVSSLNNDLEVYVFIFKDRDDAFKASITESTTISVPTNSFVYLNGINIEELTDEEFKVFKHLVHIYITNHDDYKKYFEYNASNMTFEEAIENYRALLEKKSLKIQ